jgi:hypothetical protein
MASSVYLAGSLAVLLVAVVLAFGARGLRARILGDWTGARARLAEVVLALAVPFGVAQVLGTFGQFRRFPMLFGCVAVGAVMIVAGVHRVPAGSARIHAASGAARSRSELRSRPEEVIVAIAATAAVGAQWAMHTGDALDRGMTHGDTLWYHAPFAARFVQTGYLTHASSTGLSDLATPLHGYLPLDGSLAHAIAILPYGYDVLSPVVNVGFFALALLAGWCIGARRGVGALAVLGTVVMLGLPTLTGTQPGQASNDVVTAALFFAGIALLFEGELRPAPTALAGVAAGLALGTKLTVLAPLAVVSVGVVFLAVRARRAGTAVAWCVALFLAGGYWLVRNWIVAGNPVPWSQVSLGPIELDRAIASRPALITLLDRYDTWDRFVWPGFRDALGRGWIVILVLAVGGAAVGVVRGPRGLERVAGLSALAGIVALPVVPFSADFGGGIFVFIVRYLVPEFLVGITLLVLALARGPVLPRRILTAVLAVLVLSDVTSSYIEGAKLWPRGQAATGVLAALAIAVCAAVLLRAAHGPRLARAPAIAATGALVAVLAVVGGWFVQRTYLERRYVAAGLPHDRVNAFFRDVHDAQVAAIARDHFYPLFGLDLSNRVSRVDGPRHGSGTERCRIWRQHLHGFDYVVLGSDPFSEQGPQSEWVATDPAVTVALRDGGETVYRVRGGLDPTSCP